jgi:hypothetical protein
MTSHGPGDVIAGAASHPPLSFDSVRQRGQAGPQPVGW